MTLVLTTELDVPADFDVDSLFDADGHRFCQVVIADGWPIYCDRSVFDVEYHAD